MAVSEAQRATGMTGGPGGDADVDAGERAGIAFPSPSR
jgi:hypothetical protein